MEGQSRVSEKYGSREYIYKVKIRKRRDWKGNTKTVSTGGMSSGKDTSRHGISRNILGSRLGVTEHMSSVNFHTI